jgi:DNA-binding transcriptional regulator/RsmH inhibitor MraZ
MLMPHPYFMDELQAWSRLDPRNSDQRTFLNLSASYADLLTMDPQNRIKLSPQLCDYCNIRAGEKALVVGSIQYMQLFNPDLWTSLFDGGMARFDRAANAVADRQNAPRPINLYLEAMNGKQRDESHADDE